MYARLRLVSYYNLLALCCSLLAGCQSLLPTPTPTPQLTRTIGASTLDMIELWRFHTGPATASLSNLPFLFVADGKVIISYSAGTEYGQENYDSLLTALSLETGQPVWQTRLIDPEFGTLIETAHVDTERLYLVYSYRLNAFSLDTGKLLWSTPSLGGATEYQFRPWDSDNPLLLHSIRGQHEVTAIDPLTGAVLSRQHDAGELIQHDQVAFVLTPQGLYAIDRQTGQSLWQRLELQPDYRQLQLWPSFIGNDMVFESGAPCYRISRVSARTGQVAWETPERNYLSNFALAASRVYTLREDTKLVALDVESGNIIGTLKFDGPSARTVCAHGGSDVYWVVTNGAYVLLFFGDTQELILLKDRTDSQP